MPFLKAAVKGFVISFCAVSLSAVVAGGFGVLLASMGIGAYWVLSNDNPPIVRTSEAQRARTNAMLWEIAAQNANRASKD